MTVQYVGIDLPAWHGSRPTIEAFTFEIDILAKRTSGQLARRRGYRAIQAIPGVGPVLERCSWPRPAK
jgi:hypothetical protein